MLNKSILILITVFAGMTIAHTAHANNLTVSAVTLGTRNASAKTVIVTFNAAWSNSWRNKINHDALWLTVRLNNPSVSPANKQLCQIAAAGLNPTGTSVGSASNLEIYVPSDRMGAFLRRSSNGTAADVSSQSVQLTVNYQSCGFVDSDEINANVFGLEMVFIPQGSFYAGDYNASTASLNTGSADSSPWNIISENAIAVSNPASAGYRYVSGGNSGESATGSSFSVPAVFPKGYNSFYVMKYEINEGQWVEFLNSLPSAAARANRDLTDASHKNSDSVIARNTISCSGSPLTCSTQRASRPVSYLSWMDLAAFLDWSALRPLTELEFEKLSRGPVLPVAAEYVWGSTDITAGATISATEDGTETVLTSGANANYNSTILTGGDAVGGAGYNQGVLRNGIFATSSSTRITAGASYYGVLDLAGNLKERTVSIGNATGLAFTGAHGNGLLTTAAGFEGNADVTAWPGLNATVAHGVTGAAGAGFRGGSWSEVAARLQISDRYDAALTSTDALNNFGGRGARTYDGN